MNPPSMMRCPDRKPELRLHRLQQIEVDQPLTESARRLELRLIGLKETEHVPQILRALALRIKQTLADAFAIDAEEILIDAQD